VFEKWLVTCVCTYSAHATFSDCLHGEPAALAVLSQEGRWRGHRGPLIACLTSCHGRRVQQSALLMGGRRVVTTSRMLQLDVHSVVTTQLNKCAMDQLNTRLCAMDQAPPHFRPHMTCSSPALATNDEALTPCSPYPDQALSHRDLASFALELAPALQRLGIGASGRGSPHLLHAHTHRCIHTHSRLREIGEQGFVGQVQGISSLCSGEGRVAVRQRHACSKKPYRTLSSVSCC
jgi:hypothetical protein